MIDLPAIPASPPRSGAGTPVETFRLGEGDGARQEPPPGANEAPRAPTACPAAATAPVPATEAEPGSGAAALREAIGAGDPADAPDDEVGDGVCMSFGGSSGGGQGAGPGGPAPTEEPKPPEAEGARPRAPAAPAAPLGSLVSAVPPPVRIPGLPEPAGQDLAPVPPAPRAPAPAPPMPPSRRVLLLAGDPDDEWGFRTSAPPSSAETGGITAPDPSQSPGSGEQSPGAPAPLQAMRARTLEAPVNILLIGSGGREHALAAALARSPLCDRLLCAPGNPGTAQCGENVTLDVSDHGAVAAFCRREDVGLVVVGPEAPLVAGLVDDLTAAGIRAFGPGREAARLEGSKGYTKELCAQAGIPTAAFARFSALEPARAYVAERGAPIVVKADGLAAGKGVVVAMTLDEALAAIEMMFEGGLGAAGTEVVVEEFLEGEEASFFALCDGTRAIPFGTAQDHKRVGDGDVGPNTGGMGAYSPAPVLTPAIQARVMREIVEPTLAAMAARGAPYKGVLYAGLMLTAEGPKLIEYNARFGDPECQVLMPRLASDLVEALVAACDGALDGLAVSWSDETALTVVMAAAGYPGAPRTGTELRGVEAAEAMPGVRVYQAGTRLDRGRLLSAGGRVLNVTAVGATPAEAQTRAYAGVDRIDWPQGFCRRDIGRRAVERERG